MNLVYKWTLRVRHALECRPPFSIYADSRKTLSLLHHRLINIVLRNLLLWIRCVTFSSTYKSSRISVEGKHSLPAIHFATSHLLTAKMLPFYLFTALISTTASVPTANYPPPPPYVSNCASALYDWEYQWFAGLFPWDRCDEIFFNVTRREYQPAIAYNIEEGAWCQFYEYVTISDVGLRCSGWLIWAGI
jgi:hypothetical protein